MQIETASESSTKTKVSAEESEKALSPGGDSNPEESLPFHKHPRWKQQLETKLSTTATGRIANQTTS